MSPEVLVAVLSLAGTVAGSLLGVVASNRLTAYRIERLEKQMEKHNNLVERMALVEASAKSAHRRLDELHEDLEKA